MKDTVECLLQIHKAHVDWLGKLSINPQAPCGGYRAGPVFHDRDENHIVPLESEGSTIGQILLSSTLALKFVKYCSGNVGWMRDGRALHISAGEERREDRS
ncbi:hypothetical protein L3Q82_019552, partial [Scortum barcoo]